MATKNNTATINKAWYALAATRILIGFIFVWAFFDKLLGLGLATPEARSWINGASPTTGYLSGVEGPFAGIFNAMAGQAWADWLFMIGLLCVGTALVLGIAVRVATISGSFLMVMMWAASLPLTTNPYVDDHLVYVTALAAIGFGLPEQRLSLQGAWRRLPVVRDNSWLW